MHGTHPTTPRHAPPVCVFQVEAALAALAAECGLRRVPYQERPLDALPWNILADWVEGEEDEEEEGEKVEEVEASAPAAQEQRRRQQQEPMSAAELEAVRAAVAAQAAAVRQLKVSVCVSECFGGGGGGDGGWRCHEADGLGLLGGGDARPPAVGLAAAGIVLLGAPNPCCCPPPRAFSHTLDCTHAPQDSGLGNKAPEVVAAVEQLMQLKVRVRACVYVCGCVYTC